MSQLANPLHGQMIRGYSLEHLLGRGALTAVYHAQTQESWQLPELIITVLLLPEIVRGQARSRFIERFTHESRQLISLRHSHLLPVYGFGEHDIYPYLLTPNTHGTVLAVRLRERQRWSPTEVLSIITPLATVLDYLHAQGLVCQFLTPSNILVQDDSRVLLTGIGFTRMLRNDKLIEEGESCAYPHLRSLAGTYLGGAEYLAPEVIQDAKVDKRADIYSLGILLFELLSGQPPFTGKDYVETARKHIREPLPSLHEICSDLPVALEIIINRALHRNPERRYQKASDLVTAYAHALHDYLNTPRHMALLQTVQQIRTLPAPTPSLTLMLPSPQHQKPVSPAWPLSLLTDIQQTRPQLPANIRQSTAELALAQIAQATQQSSSERSDVPEQNTDEVPVVEKSQLSARQPALFQTVEKMTGEVKEVEKMGGSNGHPAEGSRHEDFDKMTQEIRATRERLENRAREYAHYQQEK